MVFLIGPGRRRLLQRSRWNRDLTGIHRAVLAEQLHARPVDKPGHELGRIERRPVDLDAAAPLCAAAAFQLNVVAVMVTPVVPSGSVAWT